MTVSVAHFRRTNRHGAVVVEMILVLVVLLVATIGLVQFGVFLANAQQVALAARVGALKASQTADLPISDGDVPPAIVSAIEHQLAGSGIAWSAIRVEHNVHPVGEQVALTLVSDPACQCQISENLAHPPGRGYVRVTVCVPLAEVMPGQLSYFGSHIYDAHKTYEHSALFRYELDQP